MCSIFGCIVPRGANLERANHIFNVLIERSHERGRDGRGFNVLAQERDAIVQWDYKDIDRYDGWTPLHIIDAIDEAGLVSIVGNLRAEPTTEYVDQKSTSDQQPYQSGPWTIVHNGTIANDKHIRDDLKRTVDTNIDSAAIAELLDSQEVHNAKLDVEELGRHFHWAVMQLKGSYAILATHSAHPGVVFTACNYRPIWYGRHDGVTYFASSRDYFVPAIAPQMIEPYSVHVFLANGATHRVNLPQVRNGKALVICSGGLDSVVAATWALREGFTTDLLHFRYGSRAEGPEVEAIGNVADALGVNVRYFDLPIYKPEDSPLLQADSKIAGGEAGAEFAHEWVPARNLAMLAIATALAEAGGYETLILGNNLEEAGAYPDNEPEFIAKFNDLLPFAVGDGKKLKVLMPVGNLMKHEIVALGHQLGAPLDKTWSCYRAGHQHCGTCGPCFMRRTAFEINELPEVITYANERA